MYKATLVLVILGATFAGEAALAQEPQEQNKPVLAVFNTDDWNAGLGRAELDMLSDDLTAGVEKALPGFKVVAPRVLKRALVDAMKGKFDACFDKLCQFSLGKEVDANFVLSSTISRVGKRCILTAIIWDVDKKVSVVSSTGKGGCERQDLITTVNRAGRRFQDKLLPVSSGRRKAP